MGYVGSQEGITLGEMFFVADLQNHHIRTGPPKQNNSAKRRKRQGKTVEVVVFFLGRINPRQQKTPKHLQVCEIVISSQV